MPHGFHGHGIRIAPSRGGRGRRFRPQPWPYYEPDVEVIEYDPDDDNPDTIEDTMNSAFVGTARGARFHSTDRLVNMVKVLAPPTKVELLSELHGTLLVINAWIDGHHYQGSLELAGIISDIQPMLNARIDSRIDHAKGRIKQWHTQWHDEADDPLLPIHHPLVGGDPLIGAVHEQVNLASQALVGAMLDEHDRMIVAGWWHNLTQKIKHAATAVEHGVQKTMKVLGPVISVAAGAAATVFGGPVAGALAGKLAGALTGAIAGHGGEAAKQAAQGIVDAAKVEAQTNPTVAKALDAAHKAVAQVTTGYHVVRTIQQAAGGDPAAQQQLAELTQAATNGDAAAQQALATAHAASGAPATDTSMPADDSTVSSGDAADALRSHAQQSAARTQGTIVAVAIYADGMDNAAAFSDTDTADAWFEHEKSHPNALYVAYFDKSDPTWPHPLNEQLGHLAASPTVSGWPALALAGLLGVAAGRYGGAAYEWGKQLWHHNQAPAA